jgi:hypothetical protein
VRAAEAIERAEIERLARVKIEQQLAPRVLSAEQADAIRAAAQQRAGVTIDILQVLESHEVYTFRDQLARALDAGGWKPRA